MTPSAMRKAAPTARKLGKKTMRKFDKVEIARKKPSSTR